MLLSRIEAEDIDDMLRKTLITTIGDMSIDIDIVELNVGTSSPEDESINIEFTNDIIIAPGCAGNIAVNVSEFGCDSSTFIPFGDNNWMLWTLLMDHNIKIRMIHNGSPDIIIKILNSDGQLIRRIDHVGIDNSQDCSEIISAIDAELEHVMKSDYNYGIIIADYEERGGPPIFNTRLINHIVKNDISTFYTSRHGYKNYPDRLNGPHNYIILNEKELGTDEIRPNTVVTLGSRGSTMLTYDCDVLDIHTEPIEGKVNPCGCGDTFLSLFASLTTIGLDHVKTLELCNSAAGMVARKLIGTGYVRLEDLVEEVEDGA